MKIKKFRLTMCFTFTVSALVLSSCGHRLSQYHIYSNSDELNDSEYWVVTDSVVYDPDELKNSEYWKACFSADTDSTVTTPSETLNEIRFGNWTAKDWFDNDYLRELRVYLDKVYRGEVLNEDIEKYKSTIHSKFAVYKVEPYLLGGLYVQIVFLDAPDKVFEGQIYSYVDEDKETITGYEVRGLRLSDIECNFTKERILDLVAEHPEMKLY